MRQASETTIKTRAFRAFVDADARLKKAEARQAEMDALVNDATEARKAALAECKRLGVPVAE